MAKTELTFEAVNAVVEKAQLSAFAKGGKYHLSSAKARALAPGDIISNICPIYRIVKPIIEFIAPILPAKWKDALRAFIRVMDVVCPS